MSLTRAKDLTALFLSLFFVVACGAKKVSSPPQTKGSQKENSEATSTLPTYGKREQINPENAELLTKLQSRYLDISFAVLQGLIDNDVLKSTLTFMLSDEAVINHKFVEILFGERSVFREKIGHGRDYLNNAIVVNAVDAFDKQSLAFILEHRMTLKASKTFADEGVQSELTELRNLLDPKSLTYDVDYENLTPRQIIDTSKRIREYFGLLPVARFDIGTVQASKRLGNGDYQISLDATLDKTVVQMEQGILLTFGKTAKHLKNELELRDLTQTANFRQQECDVAVEYDKVQKDSAQKILNLLSDGHTKVRPEITRIVLGARSGSRNADGTEVEVDAASDFDLAKVQAALE